MAAKDFVPVRALDWVAGVAGDGSRIGKVAYLPGSGFHANHAIDVLGADGVSQHVVLRRWAGAGWELTDAEFNAPREASVLELLADSPVPAPRLLAADPAGEHCGVPALLLTLLPGRPPDRDLDERALLGGLAAVAEAIHSVAARGVAPAYRRYVPPERLAVPTWSARPRLWERAIEVASGPPPPGRQCLIHRDFHPGNTLWENGRLSGVVDWSYASWGPAAVDAASLRWNLAVEPAPHTADRLLEIGDALDHHPYWDVVTLLDLVCDLPGEEPDRTLRERLERYLDGVLS